MARRRLAWPLVARARSSLRLGRRVLRREASLPPQFLCPITGEIMRDPVTTCDGHAFERAAIERWLQSHRTSPMTGMRLESTQLVPAISLRQLIEGAMRRRDGTEEDVDSE